MTAGFLGSKGEKFVAELPRQRNEADNRLDILTTLLDNFDPASYGQVFYRGVKSMLSDLEELRNNRRLVDSLEVDPSVVIGYYTNLNGCSSFHTTK